MNLLKRLVLVTVLYSTVILTTVGCAITTTYGVEPKQDQFDSDVYTFTVYYNVFSAEDDIAKNANRQIKKSINESGYVDSKIINVSIESGKSLYEVKFFREEQQ